MIAPSLETLGTFDPNVQSLSQKDNGLWKSAKKGAFVHVLGSVGIILLLLPHTKAQMARQAEANGTFQLLLKCSPKKQLE